MNATRPRIRRFRIGEVSSWEQARQDGRYLHNVVNDAREGLLTVGFVRGSTGATLDSRFPFDEVLIVTKGAITYQVGHVASTARAGDFAYCPSGAQVVGRFDEDTEAVCIVCPPRWQLADADWLRIGRGPAPSAAVSDSTARVEVFSMAHYPLDRMGDLEYYSAAVVDDPGFELSVKFERVGTGVSGDHFFPYDEVHVVREGILTIRTEEETIRVEAGEVVHLPMRARAVVQADANVEMVSVTYPPHWHLRAVTA
jgi:ethanolamine utilization protein EutQ (cupin superfamily)